MRLYRAIDCVPWQCKRLRTSSLRTRRGTCSAYSPRPSPPAAPKKQAHSPVSSEAYTGGRGAAALQLCCRPTNAQFRSRLRCAALRAHLRAHCVHTYSTALHSVCCRTSRPPTNPMALPSRMSERSDTLARSAGTKSTIAAAQPQRKGSVGSKRNPSGVHSAVRDGDESATAHGGIGAGFRSAAAAQTETAARAFRAGAMQYNAASGAEASERPTVAHWTTICC